MELYCILIMFAVIINAGTQVVHQNTFITGCSDTEKEYMNEFDGEELYHADFITQKGVITLPDFADPSTFEGFYENAVANVETCKNNLNVMKKAVHNPSEKIDPPVTSIYSKDVVDLDVENSLICHVTGFFPPPVNISWTKNNEIVTEGMSLSQYRLKSDGTFIIFSTMTFTPAEGDIYSCTVYHKSIEGQPMTRTWEVEVAVPSVGPAVVCGMGLFLGLLGVAAGTFFLIKGNNCN
ncbi:SLA class II histocompatibility antigen, DQ haplotype D alpha chain-like [Garra rufa]|uniref:SLA class II histocompatibility antigen, DQ haplotype D alpha chain-like n=1 Tax=Garra rufa TaxID=137080 RepID=UPI003CCE7D75